MREKKIRTAMNMTSAEGVAEWGKEGREFRLWAEQGDTKKSRL